MSAVLAGCFSSLDFCSAGSGSFDSDFFDSGLLSTLALFSPLDGRLFGAPVDSLTEPLDVPREPLDDDSEEEDESDLLAVARWSLPKKSHQTLSTLSGSFW